MCMPKIPDYWNLHEGTYRWLFHLSILQCGESELVYRRDFPKLEYLLVTHPDMIKYSEILWWLSHP